MTANVLVLRVCHADMSSSREFVWPASGHVEAPDWSPVAECGHGLHGWLWGAGDPGVANGVDDPASRWIVVEVERAEIVDLVGKVKFPRGTVVFCGDRADAVAMVRANAPIDTASLWATLTGGDGSTLTGGDGSTLTGGYGSTLTGGDRSTLVARWWCEQRGTYRMAVAEVGENGTEPGVAYHIHVVDDVPVWRRADGAL